MRQVKAKKKTVARRPAVNIFISLNKAISYFLPNKFYGSF